MTKAGEKQQTPAQRLANPVWLRAQIRWLIQECAFNIDEDRELADKTGGDVRDRYLASVQTTSTLKKHLERILRGKTSNEALRDDLSHMGAAP